MVWGHLSVERVKKDTCLESVYHKKDTCLGGEGGKRQMLKVEVVGR